MDSLKLFLAFALIMAGLTFIKNDISHAGKASIYQGIVSGVAVGGYDPVAYFKKKKPVKGSKDLVYKYKGAEWRFSSKANLAAFKANPKAYAPQYGGYCAWAVSQGYTAKGDPLAWSIYKGKLYLNFTNQSEQPGQKTNPATSKKATPTGHLF